MVLYNNKKEIKGDSMTWTKSNPTKEMTEWIHSSGIKIIVKKSLTDENWNIWKKTERMEKLEQKDTRLSAEGYAIIWIKEHPNG
jgi:hypothetical protein